MPISYIETASLDTALNAPTATALSTASGSAPSYSARAWVNFNGTGTVAIRASGNVSSITDNGTGDYTVNFTTAMADANYSAVAAATDTGNPLTALNAVAVVGTKATSSIRAVLRTVSGAITYFDANTYDVAIFR
jgi:hypothetical protein